MFCLKMQVEFGKCQTSLESMRVSIFHLIISIYFNRILNPEVPADEIELAEASVEAMQERERKEKDGLFRARDCKAEAFDAIASDDPSAFESAVLSLIHI